MTREPDGVPGQPAASAGLHATDGAIVAGGNVNNSSTQFVQAQQAFVLPAEAYAPIPSDAPGRGVSNIRTGLFVGRSGELGALDAAFADPGDVVVHAVHGLGGVGKSALAARWAAGRGESVRWWVTADTAAAVDAGVAALARALQPGLTGLPAELQAERAVRWLADHPGRWLLVLDNVEDPSHIRPLLDRVSGGRVLVTTRVASGWHRHATAIRLGVLEPADALDLFTRILTHHGPRDTEGADAVCAELGYLALAVDQAAAYCAETGTTPGAYLDMLARWPAEMFAATAEGGDSARTIARIWRLTLDRLTDTPLAGELLRLLAWYGPDRIPRDLLDGVADPPVLVAAVGRLVAYNMVTDNHDGTVSVHRLVQALARTPDPDDPHRSADDIDRARDTAAELLAAAYPHESGDPANWPRYRALVPHTDALAAHHTADHDTTHTALALNQAAVYRHEHGELGPALEGFQRALTTRERVLGADHPHTLVSRNNFAAVLHAAGDLGRAIPVYEQTLRDAERVLGVDHPNTLRARNNLASATYATGDRGRAVPLYEQVLSDRARVLGPDHPDTLTSRYNLAGMYESAGDLDEAIPLYAQTLADRMRVLGADHPDTLDSQNTLAGALHAAGDLGLAVPLYEQTLADRVRVLGPDHPGTLGSRNNLAGVYESAGDLDRAIPLYEQNLTDAERILGADHPDTLVSRNNLAYVYHSAGDLDRAVPLFEQSHADRVRLLGPEHPDTLMSRNNLAGAYESAGDLDRAIPLYEQNLTDTERVMGPDHPNTLTCRGNLAGVYESAGDLDRAIPLYEQTFADMERVLGPDHPNTLTCRSNLASAYQWAGDLGRAVPLFEQTLADRVRVLGPDHPDTLVSRNNLAGAYESAGDLGRAIPLFEQTLTDAKRVLSRGNPMIAVVRANLERARSTGGPKRGLKRVRRFLGRRS
ncbi:tetratricopeptide repeat protein [Yinghuangia seranimata]|uniref:tetratricopeptide repeat protein n=1 Tax=Yinghuangia seranimata TaxID=408067 RepID=UPI00248B0572|nr:tetratricopeptide repeat protein [Yinghuangia seranimata]MDI2129021.1 tetratricopeptide repeat protein [Yinghuangia seranimata]